jgi:hypothetical protein
MNAMSILECLQKMQDIKCFIKTIKFILIEFTLNKRLLRKQSKNKSVKLTKVLFEWSQQWEQYAIFDIIAVC